MKKWLDASFQRKLMAAFLAVGIVPLLVCVALMLNVFRVSLAQEAEKNATSQLSAAAEGMGQLVEGCETVMAQLGKNRNIVSALAGEAVGGRQAVYNTLYQAAAPLLREADFALYDGTGKLLYTTGSSMEPTLPANWGLLAAARDSETVVYRNGENGLQGAEAVYSEGRLVGYVAAQVTDSQFSRLFDGKYGADSDVIVLDAYWDEVYLPSTIRDRDLVPTLRDLFLSGEKLSSGDTVYHVAREERTGCYLLLRQPKPVADWIMELLYLVASLAILLCLGLGLAVAMGFSRQLFRPIRALNDAMAAVEGGDLDARVKVTGADEMSQLAGRFNRMAERLQENLAQSIRQQQELGNTQIRMMQAQLNPHFLYNTLDTLKWMGKIHHIPEVSTISTDLADILRQSVSQEEFVTLGEELRLLDRYVEIQKIRFEGKFDYQTEIDEGLLDVKIPKLMLQPLVENAIIHGFEDGVPGEVRVTGVQAGGEMVLTVRDTGRGMSRESLEQFEAHRGDPAGRHLGLHNVDAILRLRYGEDHGLTFLPQTGGRGTCVRVTLPIQREGEGAQ